MSNRYTHARVQEYWQHVWDRKGVYELDDAAIERGEGTYVLGMFPYTSGSLHMGHIRNYAITDAVARYRRMSGESVLHPMGWDAFGLPAENAAYERNTDPESWTRTCIEQMRDELERMGFGYDWSREITTCDPEYYRWNQWLFTRFYENDLVEYTGAQVNWCPDCETVLADAQVDTNSEAAPDTGTRDDTPGHASGDGVCWRCGTAVERRELDQWFFTITDYAEELLAGLDDLDGWPESVREIQRNWIGRREGAEITFAVDGDPVDVFTTRPDTVFGATYLAVAPGHDIARRVAAENDAVADFLDRTIDGDSEGMAGVDTGLTASNPVTGEEIPVYVASYVLDDVATGAVMGVPAHNERDRAFASEHDLPVEQVVEPTGGEDATLPFTADGVVAAGEYEGLESEAVRERLLDHDDIAAATTYRLRDWLISRQRYWGTPIPIVHCEDCGTVPVPDEDLPVELPEYVQTTGNPLDAIDEFVETECPACGGPAERETDTMDTFVDSSWYFLRYLNPGLADAPFDSDVADDWLPVDVYVGGDEHAVLHLLYIRFFTRALADLGLLDQREPVERLVNQGTVLHGGEKMSKSKGNDVAPHEYGAETTRLFVLSAAHPGQDFEWTATDVRNAYEFQQDVYGMVSEFAEGEGGGESPSGGRASGEERPASSRTERKPHDAYLEREIDRTIAAVSDEYERFRFHRVVTEIQQFAQLLRRYREYDTPYRFAYSRGLRVLAKLLAPLAPYLTEELWSMLDGEGLIAGSDWPQPLQAIPDYRTERELVRTTLSDVREITQIVDITDPDEIELVVAPDWAYRAYEIAREVPADGPVVGRVMEDDAVPGTDAAADYAAELAERSGGFEPVLAPEAALTVLEQARWLFVDEFGAEVSVRQADPESEYADSARPNKPAIHIS